jgi:hypothetical protein
MHLPEAAWESLKREFDTACSESARDARLQAAQELNQFVRRFRQYRTEAEWVSCILSGAGKFVGQLAVFSLQNGMLRLRGQQNFDFPEDLTFPLESAGAFGSAVDTRDPVVALRSPGEVGAALSTQDPTDRAHIFPIANGSRVSALIFVADADSVDLHALELIAAIGSLVLERQSNTALHAHISAPKRNPDREGGESSTGRPAPPLPAWADLDENQRSLHIRAQRFSRVTVAELQLSRPEACRAGRDQANLYVFLKSELDKARDAYRKQFMTIPSMVDYLHLELVRTAADGDELKLGADYPGQLV